MATYPEINHSLSFTTGQQHTIDRALALLQSRLIQGDALSSPRQVRQYCRLQLAGQRDEYSPACSSPPSTP